MNGRRDGEFLDVGESLGSGSAPGPDWLMHWYVGAKRAVVDAGYVDEIAWQASTRLQYLSTDGFVREAAWVILSSGMSERVVRRIFPDFAASMYLFDVEKLALNQENARRAAIAVFGHARKISAILEIAARARELSDAAIRDELARDAEGFLTGMPYIGPVTWRHLAKNVGVAVAKPDRHLVRLSIALGRSSVDELCHEIAELVADPVSVVDVVLWRWSVEKAGKRSRDGLAEEAPVLVA
jgi:hypothetical protein